MPIRASRVVKRLFALFTWDRRHSDMEQEMAFHIESMKKDYVRSGMSESDAEQAARRRFGRVLQLKEEGHDIRASRIVEDIVRDARHMARGLRKSPVFAITVILTLAVGIGGNTAIFSVVDQLLLRPLPYPGGNQLVMVYERLPFVPGQGGHSGLTNSVSPANWMDWQRDNRTFHAMAAWRNVNYTLTGVGDPMRLNAQVVSWEFFPVIGVQPLLGRTPSEKDDQPNAPLVAVISYRLWQQRFGGDSGVVGRMVQLNDRPVEIIGVMPAGFHFVQPDVDLWGAYRLNRSEPWRQTSGRFVGVIARLKSDTSIDTARRDMEAIATRLAATYEFNKNTSVTLMPLREVLTGEVESTLLVLYAAVGVLLAIACVNVANLLLARSASRRRELALRTSLGAGRIAVIRQLLIESLLLAFAGGALGIVLARWCLDALMALAPVGLLRVADLVVDRRVLLYALAISSATGIIVGFVPAILAARQSLIGSLRAGATNLTQSPRLRQGLVVCQVAMTVILLCGSGLLVRTVIALDRANNGFDKRNVLTMEIGLPAARYTPERRQAFFREATSTLQSLPGVEAVAGANSLPVVGSPRGGTIFHRLGTPELPMNDRPVAIIRVVLPGFFQALGIPVKRGREFTDADATNPTPGFVVNEAFAKAFLADIDPLTASVSVLMQSENPYAPVIGVVADVSEGSIRDQAQPTIFYSHRQLAEATMTLFIKGQGAAALNTAAVAAVRRLDPSLAISRVQTIEGAFSTSVARERLGALISAAFALSGLLLVSLGLYGLLAYLVTERTKEIGIRIALGAHIGRLTRSVIGGGLRLVTIGAAVGTVGSLLLLGSLGPMLFGVTPRDISTYSSVLALVWLVAIFAAYVPARRASRVQPLLALREE
jgi:putative ABC transport system permease protein